MSGRIILFFVVVLAVGCVERYDGMCVFSCDYDHGVCLNDTDDLYSLCYGDAGAMGQRCRDDPRPLDQCCRERYLDRMASCDADWEKCEDGCKVGP